MAKQQRKYTPEFKREAAYKAPEVFEKLPVSRLFKLGQGHETQPHNLMRTEDIIPRFFLYPTFRGQDHPNEMISLGTRIILV